MAKRLRMPVAKPGQLLVKYGQEHGERDLYYCWPDNEEGMKGDSRLLMHAFERAEIPGSEPLRSELEKRGYDITTLRFSIMKRQQEVGK